MKKIFKSQKIKYLLFFILGGIIIGGIGITATTYVLQSSEIQYDSNKSVQQAIDELYILAENAGGSKETLPLGDVTVSGTQITIPYTGDYPTIRCVYGTDENYGNEGTLSNNICTFSGSSNTRYYYKLIGTDNTGIVYENSGNKTTLTGPTRVLTNLPSGVKAIVYLDPSDISKDCNADNSNLESGTSGCMRWYAYAEDETNYKMILDHDYYPSTNRPTPSQPSDWMVSMSYITKDEVTLITGSTNWGSSYPWLNSTSYWTSTRDTSQSSPHGYYYYVNENGYLGSSDITTYYSGDWVYHGGRPVISIDKSCF